MRLPKFILIGAVGLFAFIGVASLFKERKKTESTVTETTFSSVEEIQIEPAKNAPEKLVQRVEENEITDLSPVEEEIPEVDIISRLFATDSSKLPIVETISYTSRVPWLKGRPAWVADYASHYATSRHFIARSLNKKADYFTQKITPGDRFNVFRTDKNINFRLVIDLSRCKMWFYYHDLDTDERVLLKTYDVGLGRKDESKRSGYLTPEGKYTLGSKVAIYKPGTMGYFQDQKTEMIRVFGTRWIPFEEGLEGCSESPRGYGLHGSPWIMDTDGNLHEDSTRISKYDSDGCIRLNSQEMEELFAIIITKPTIVELVKDFHEADIPGFENKEAKAL